MRLSSVSRASSWSRIVSRIARQSPSSIGGLLPAAGPAAPAAPAGCMVRRAPGKVLACRSGWLRTRADESGAAERQCLSCISSGGPDDRRAPSTAARASHKGAPVYVRR
jgi:hypothetical protein